MCKDLLQGVLHAVHVPGQRGEHLDDGHDDDGGDDDNGDDNNVDDGHHSDPCPCFSVERGEYRENLADLLFGINFRSFADLHPG